MNSIAENQQKIKLFPEIARASLLDRRDRELRLWLLLRQPAAGRGWLEYGEAVAIARRFGITRRSFQATICRGADVFWTIGRKRRLWISGLSSLCEVFGVLPIQPVYVPAEAFRELELFRASVYAAWLRSHREPIVSREKLQQLFGRSKRTLGRWERLLGIEVEGQFARSPVFREPTEDCPPTPRFLRCGCGYETRSPRLAERHARSRHGAKEWRRSFCWVWQLPNRYRVELSLAPWGRVRKLRRELQASFGQAMERLPRRYFRRASRAIRAAQAGDIAYLWERSDDRIDQGRAGGLWAHLASMDARGRLAL